MPMFFGENDREFRLNVKSVDYCRKMLTFT